MARLNLLEETRFEKLPVSVFENEDIAAKKVALRISDIIKSKQRRGENAVLGLATGATPVGVYEELVRLHQEEGLSFCLRNKASILISIWKRKRKNKIYRYSYFLRYCILSSTV